MALTFDGSAERLSADVSLISGAPVTVCGWIRPWTKKSNSIITLIESGDAASLTNTSGYLNLGPGKYGRLDFWSGKRRTNAATWPLYGSGSPAAAGTWFHMLGQNLADDTRALFVNGTSVGTGGAGGYAPDLASCDKIFIGHVGVTGGAGSGLNSDDYTDGGIAEVAAWNIQLTTNQISALAAGFSPLLIRPDKLVGYWPLGGPYAHATAYIDVVGGNTLAQEGSMDATNLEPHPPIIYPTSPTLITGGVIATPIPILASGMCT